MPYIKKEQRFIDKKIDELSDKIRTFSDEEKEGVLNYTISRLLARSMPESNWRYKYINRAIGVLECIKLELYRRIAGPYEDTAKITNGDIEEYKGF